MRRLLRSLPALLALLIAAPASPAKAEPAPPLPTALDAIASLPATNPYREALLRLNALPEADRKLLGEWAAPLPDTPAPALPAPLRAHVAELAASVRDAAAHPPTAAADWPLLPNPAEPDNPAASLTFFRYGATRELARLAVRHADDLPASEAIDYYAATAQLARQQRAAPTLIEQLVGAAVEGIAHAAASRRLDEFSAADLQRLSAAWASLLPRPTNAEAVAGEREVFFLPFVEKVLLPGLHELLANPAAGRGGDDASLDTGFTRDLRLSGLLDLGDGDQRILLENTRSGEHLTLRPGRATEGIELVSLDFERRLALIRRGTQAAEIHLQSKRIIERESPAALLRKQLGSLDVFAGNGTADHSLALLLARVRRHPDGPEGYVRDHIAAYDEGVARQLARAGNPKAPTEDETPTIDDPLLGLTLPSVGKVARTLNSSATTATALQAAIHHRLVQLGAAPDAHGPTDPWSPDQAAPFAFEPAPGGGFLLRSVYELSPEIPLTYKFAAPDAGFLRRHRPSP